MRKKSGNDVSYEQILRKAIHHNSKVDSAKSYKRAYVFYDSRSEYKEDNLVVLEKTDGLRITLEYYLSNADEDDKPVVIDFKTGEVK